MSTKHTEIFEKFSATFPPETVGRWIRMVERWESDPKAQNLYDESEQSKRSLKISLFFSNNY